MNILIVAEHDNNELKKSTLSVIAAADKLNKLNPSNIDVLVAGSSDKLNSIADDIKKLNIINKVVVSNNKSFENFLAEDFTSLINEIASDYQYILLPATTFGKNIAPRVAALLDTNPLSDVIEIIDANTFKRPIYAGNAIATYQLFDKIKLLTIRTTSFDLQNNEYHKNTEIINFEPVNINEQDAIFATYISSELSESDRPELSGADIVISGGRGLQNKENFELVESLAKVLNAAVGASRAAVDAGFVPNDYQVGQTGKIVAPNLYIAIGISGAIQHIAGMQDSKVIVAINKDADAPIFNIADYGLVGDLFEILPELTEKLNKLVN